MKDVTKTISDIMDFYSDTSEEGPTYDGWTSDCYLRNVTILGEDVKEKYVYAILVYAKDDRLDCVRGILWDTQTKDTCSIFLSSMTTPNSFLGRYVIQDNFLINLDGFGEKLNTLKIFRIVHETNGKLPWKIKLEICWFGTPHISFEEGRGYVISGDVICEQKEPKEQLLP